MKKIFGFVILSALGCSSGAFAAVEGIATATGTLAPGTILPVLITTSTSSIPPGIVFTTAPVALETVHVATEPANEVIATEGGEDVRVQRYHISDDAVHSLHDKGLSWEEIAYLIVISQKSGQPIENLWEQKLEG